MGDRPIAHEIAQLSIGLLMLRSYQRSVLEKKGGVWGSKKAFRCGPTRRAGRAFAYSCSRDLNRDCPPGGQAVHKQRFVRVHRPAGAGRHPTPGVVVRGVLRVHLENTRDLA